MLPEAHNDVQVACRRTHGPGVTTSGQSNALPVARAGLDAHLERLVPFHSSRAMAHIADRPAVSTATAARARDIDLHATALLRDLPLALALRARFCAFKVAVSVTIRTALQVR